MLQESMREMIGHGGFVELRGKPQLMQTVWGSPTEVGVQLRLTDTIRGDAAP
jgi:hypothetical protein